MAWLADVAFTEDTVASLHPPPEGEVPTHPAPIGIYRGQPKAALAPGFQSLREGEVGIHLRTNSGP